MALRLAGRLASGARRLRREPRDHRHGEFSRLRTAEKLLSRGLSPMGDKNHRRTSRVETNLPIVVTVAGTLPRQIKCPGSLSSAQNLPRALRPNVFPPRLNHLAKPEPKN